MGFIAEVTAFKLNERLVGQLEAIDDEAYNADNAWWATFDDD